MPTDPHVPPADPAIAPPPPGALVFTDENSANAALTNLNALMGYPREGVNIGGGVHADAHASRTLSVSSVQKHPTLQKWSVLLPPSAPAAYRAQSVVLDETWNPPPPIAVP